jgi:4-amino-4-deoxy-L-arabinose transferase-like glycosyltransferase
MYEIVALSTLLLSVFMLVRIIRAAGKVESILIFFCIAAAEIIFCGYLLSSVDHLSDLRYWSALGTVNLLAVFGIARAKRITLSCILPSINFKTIQSSATFVKRWYIEETSTFEKLLLTPLILVTLCMGILNLAIIIFTAPNNFDSMAYHLARMAYYLQHNNLDYYNANYYAQIVHPKNSTILLLYSYIVSGRNENMTQLIQFVAYWISVCSVYGITRRTGNNRTQGIFAALVSALLVEWLLESNTTQNDLIIAAFTGASINFLFSFRLTRQKKYLVLAALGIGLSIGTSAKSFLALPSLALIGGYILFSADTWQRRFHDLAYFAGALLLAITLYALPAGYVDNYQRFGNPIGPKEIMGESFEGKSIEYVMRNGTKNVLRFGFEFLSLDGLPPFETVLKAQSMVIGLPRAIVNILGIDLETPEASFKPFRYRKAPIFFSNEDWCSWGIFGFALVWVVILLSAVGVGSRDARILSFAAILFLLALAYGGLYEPHRGRYLITCAVFGVPTIGIVLNSRKKIVRAYVLLIVLAGCISAVAAIMFRPARPPVAMKNLVKNFPQVRSFEFLPESVFDMERIAQLSTNAWALYPAIKAFDFLVPKDATVAVFQYGDTYEYPFFGEHLTRRIIPINPFVGGVQDITADADYLLYARGYPAASSLDLYLGADLYLRRLQMAGDDAIEYLRKVVRLNPYNHIYLNNLGIEYAKKGLFNEAIMEFEAAIRMSPNEPSYRLNLNKVLGLKGSSGNRYPDPDGR